MLRQSIPHATTGAIAYEFAATREGIDQGTGSTLRYLQGPRDLRDRRIGQTFNRVHDWPLLVFEIRIEVRVEDAHLLCEIQDTGIGICPDDQRYIFDEFFQVDEPASRRYRGAGLGLTLVRDLVVLLEGEIMVESEVGAGSTFTFSIPVQVLS